MNKLLRTTAASHSNQRVRHAPPLRRTALALLISACFGGAHANPLLPQVVNGQATFTQQGNVFSVTNTPNTIINWQSFSIASGELTRFIQQNGNSAVLNRITGQDPSKILGALESNGKVFLINPNGILFGAGSRVDVGGLVASSLGMTNQDFLAGKRSFTADGTPGSVINRGAINAAGGPVLLIAPQVENSGIITAPNGDVMLAAGHSVNLADPANPDLQVVLSAPADQAINVGQVIAQGGRIGMYGALLNQRGVLNADSAVRGENGKIVLKASARALLEDGSITSATGAGSGGNITVLGDQVGVLGNARVDASGKLGGGTVLLGGDYQGKNPAVPNARQVAVGKDASIAADAIDSGNGGKIIAWGNETARVAGSLSARGGALAGDGGLVETSGHYLAVDGIRVDTRARSTRGKPGNWLLDPYDIQVVQGAGGGLSAVDAFDSGPATGTTTIGADLISNAQTDVTLQALHRIDFDAAISIVSGGVGLSATAGEQINVNAPIMTSGGAVLLSANDNSGGSAAGAGGVLHLNAAIDTGNNDLSLSGASVSGAGALYVGAGSVRIVANAAGGAISLTGAPDQVTGSGFGQNITLVADQMNLAGGFNFGGADGAATVTLRPWTNSRDIHLGSNSDSSVMGLSAQDLAGLSVANVTVGYGEGSGTISVAAPLSLATGAGGAIRMLDLRTGSGGAINIDHALTLDGGLSLSSGNIGATGAVKLGGEFVLAGDWRQNSANLPAFSAAQIKVERGTFLRVAGGDGSTAAPYRIADVYGLQGINGLDLGASFIMANNIDGGVTANWNEGQGFTPLAGGAGAGFSGVFDGAGYAIRDLKIGSNGYATGLFSVVDGGTLRNLTLSGGSVSGNSNVGALAGAVFGGTISNVSSSMAVSGVGNTGGLVGSNAGAISNASASGTVDWRLSDGGAATGGLVGKNQATGTVTASYASGAVSSGFEFVGGLVGDNAGAVTQSYATGATRGARSVGGLVGRNAGSIDDAYASGAVSLSSNADALLTRENLGGFVGESPGTVRHAYSSGHVNPAGFNASTVGAVAGSAAGSFAFGFFNYETAGIEIDHSGSSGRSTAQMMQASSFNDYDFSSTWRIYEGHTTPLLKATLKPLTVAISNAPSSVEYAGAQVAFSGTLAYTGLANGDTAADGSVGYGAARNVGTYAAGGLWSTKYDISYSGATALTIRARELGVSVGGSKIYDGGTGFGAATLALTNVVAGDELLVGVSGSAAFADRNAGAGKTVNLTGLALAGDGASNYSLASSATGSATIAPRALSLGGVSGVNRVYDGSLAATISAQLDGVLGGDQVSLTGAAASFADKNIGSAKPVTYSVQTSNLAGADAANYSLTSASGSTTADITVRSLNLSLGANSKTYDGGISATTSITDSRVGGDVLTVGGTATFSDRNAGVGKTVTLNGVTLSGADAANYVLSPGAVSGTANIDQRRLTGTFAGVDKVYDGGSGASVIIGDNRVDGDVLSLAATAAFADKNAGVGKTVSVSGVTLSGADAGNYTLASNTGSTTASITARGLTASFSGVNKTYDGTRSAIVTSNDNRIDGDVLTVAATAAFGDKNAASGKAVSVSDAHLSGADAGNYTLTSTSGSTTAAITARDLNASFAGVNKTYDGTTAASVTSSDNRIDGDVLNVAVTAAFGDKNAASGKAVSVSGAHLSGADAGNYTLTSTSGSTTAAITARELSASFAGVNKTYDGATAASVTSSDNRIDGDVLNVAATAVFGDKNVASGKAVSVSGAHLSGADAGNYTLTSTSGSTTAAITARELSASFAGVNKTYDGTTAASVTSSDNRIDGDVLNVAATAVFGDKNVASGKEVSVSGAHLSGADAGNYTLTSTSGSTTATITARDLNASFAGVNKTYDGTTAASVTSSDNRIDGDVLNVTATAAFGNKNAAGGKAVSVSDAHLSGTDAGNYTLTSTSGSTTAAITARELSASFAGVNKTYDGTTAAGVTSSDNRIDGDVLNVAANAVFGDKNAASGKVVSVSGARLSGADAGNYTLTSTSGSTTAAITARALNASFAGVNKTYDGTRSASVTSSDNRINGDVLNVTATATFGDKNAASGKAVSISDARLSGADAGNYTLTSTSGLTTAAITTRDLNASFAGVNKTYDGTRRASVTSSDNRINGDVLNVTATATFGDKNAASGKAVSISDARLSGADAGNYTLTSTIGSTTAAITARDLNASFAGVNKTYDGTTAASVTSSDNRIDGDVLNVAATAAFGDKNAASGKAVSVSGVTLSGADAGNYTLASSTTSTTAAITARDLNASFAGVNKTYDGTRSASVTSSDNRIDGDVLNVAATAAFGD
ncbi:YDG domain-containing protein, partial [Massilia sp. S19_KUP03_FR1]|uniref:YDG domain-containing protein n=1 Tax=Massilia sp. S19_KUP03_FR1 TaxID=3025503 RepID=UPI002FCD2AC8